MDQDGFQLRAETDGQWVTLRFAGNGDAGAVSALGRFLTSVHREVSGAGIQEVTVDLGELYFLNSSCLKQLVTWIHEISASESPYKIRFQTNPRQPWQSRSLATLQRLAPNTVFLEQRASALPPEPNPHS